MILVRRAQSASYFTALAHAANYLLPPMPPLIGGAVGFLSAPIPGIPLPPGFIPAAFMPAIQHFPIFILSIFMSPGFMPAIQHILIFFFSAADRLDIILPIFMPLMQHAVIFFVVAFAGVDLAGILLPLGIPGI